MLSLALLWRLCVILWTPVYIQNTEFIQSRMDVQVDQESDEPNLEFSHEWKVLGPFQIGTREAVWGADPLEALGGFHSLSYDENDRYQSSLGTNGTVSWHRITSKVTNTADSSSVELTVHFPDVDWRALRAVYGWAAVQYQGWARGTIEGSRAFPRSITLYTDHILEIWLNDARVFGGDFYAFRRAPLVVTLTPGSNVIDLRLIREIRSMGGANSYVTVTLEAQAATDALRIVENSAVLPDLVNGRLPSALGGVTVRNEGQRWIQMCDCGSPQVPTVCPVLLEWNPTLTIWQMSRDHRDTSADGHVVVVAPGQSRPISFFLEMDEIVSNRITKTLCFRTAGTDSPVEMRKVHLDLKARSISEPHRITFLHPSGVVSYAILTPPSDVGNRHRLGTSLPVLLNLHGAGLEADSHQVRHMLDAVPDLPAWTLFPTGMSPWSGDDWHAWGLADIKAAILALPEWIDAMRWDGPGVFTNRWVVTGHSNGGQGTWYLLTHQPDPVMAAAAVSGYSSIENYVPYTMWKQAPPLLTAVVQQALSSFRHELLIENTAGTPIVVQHGSSDDNVPPYHSRLMNSLLREIGADINYVELANIGHWFDGAMATEALQAFYHRYLRMAAKVKVPPTASSSVFPTTDDMGSHWGIAVDQLQSPDVFGRVDLSRSGKIWRLSTMNIRRLHFDFTCCQTEPPDTIFLDGNEVAWLGGNDTSLIPSFVQSKDGQWEEAEADGRWKTLHQRYGRQRGALDSIMRTRGAFNIRMCSNNTLDMAVQISRNLYQYYHADSSVTNCSNSDRGQSGNTITLAMGNDLPSGQLKPFPINLLPQGIELRRFGRSTTKVIPLEAGLGAIFLRPLENEQLEVVVWGMDEGGLRLAARLIPTLTGVGQADFIILSRRAQWLGHAGAVAMGFFDFEWRISERSFIP